MRPRIRDCLMLAARAVGVSPEAVCTADRSDSAVVLARGIGMWLAMHATSCSSRQIGTVFRHDASTVRLVAKRIEARRQIDPELDDLTGRLLAEITTGRPFITVAFALNDVGALPETLRREIAEVEGRIQLPRPNWTDEERQMAARYAEQLRNCLAAIRTAMQYRHAEAA